MVVTKAEFEHLTTQHNFLKKIQRAKLEKNRSEAYLICLHYKYTLLFWFNFAASKSEKQNHLFHV